MEQHQFSCPSKSLLGMECPGCGMQRSFILLMRGEFADSLLMYPGLIPTFVLLIFLVLHLIFRFEKGAKILQWLYISTVVIVLAKFIVRQVFLFQHS